MLLVLTPIGVAGGLYEAYRVGGGLVILMVALLLLISVAMGSIVYTVRKERRAEQEKLKPKE
jgi:flagellar basal body-associated protein FliL